MKKRETRGAQIVRLAILDGYKVRWSRETVARDVVQNFFDETPDFRDVHITIDDKAKTIEVKGPSEVHLDYLRYIGATTKGASGEKEGPARRTAGGFGEGFKICALVLLRDFKCDLAAGSGAWEIRPVLSEVKLGRELCYEVRHLAPSEAYKGSFVRIRRADKKLRDAFRAVRDQFRHPENPRLQEPLFVDDASGIGVYVPKNESWGFLFYRKQSRGDLRFPRGNGLTFAFDDRIASLDADRDRRNLSAARPVVREIAKRLPDDILEKLIRRLRVYWQGGNALLGPLVREAARRGMKLSFGRRWVARGKFTFALEAHAEKVGCHVAIRAMGEIGMPTIVDRFATGKTPRALTPIENTRMAVARALYIELAGRQPMFERVFAIDIDDAIGSASDWADRYGVVRASALALPYHEGITECLAALAVTRGKQEVHNADRLTWLLEGAVRRAGGLSSYEARWDAAAQDPDAEAGPAPEADEADSGAMTRRIRSFMYVCVLAPPGFPPAKRLRDRISALMRELAVHGTVIDVDVCNRRDAIEQWARGVPSVWIGDQEIAPPKPGKVGYFLRTFPGPDGPALMPTDDVLKEALVRESKRQRGHKATRRWKRGERALLRELRRSAPSEYRNKKARDAVGAAMKKLPRDALPREIWTLHSLLARRARATMATTAWEEPTLQDAANSAIAEAASWAHGLLRELGARVPVLVGGRPVENAALEAWLSQLEESLSVAADPRAALDRALPDHVDLGAALAELAKAASDAPLDAQCAIACWKWGKDRLLAAWRREEPLVEGEPQQRTSAIGDARTKARTTALEAVAAAVSFALERHEIRDEYGDPPACSDLGEALTARFAAKEPGEAEKQHDGEKPAEASNEATPATTTDPVEAAVIAVWEHALASGATQIAAAEACLVAAEWADALWDRSPARA